ncbi:MAG: DUF350 domain-containing protein [Dechloromonas sp.]|jgi:putative membrane protein|nr:DUF350 domain-containing protein [Dechloromonas sp.]
MLDQVLNNLPGFAMYFAAAIVILAVFLAVYAFMTPYDELTLIRQGNAAASVSLAGTLLGIALPVAVAVAVSHNLYTMAGWGTVACVIQLAVFAVARIALPQLAQDIPAGKVASGVFVASLSLGIGVINAACIV